MDRTTFGLIITLDGRSNLSNNAINGILIAMHDKSLFLIGNFGDIEFIQLFST